MFETLNDLLEEVNRVQIEQPQEFSVTLYDANNNVIDPEMIELINYISSNVCEYSSTSHA